MAVRGGTLGGTLRVEGLHELQAAFALAEKGMARDLRQTLREAAEPVAFGAQILALTRIRNMDQHWSRMRVGATRRSVYVAPYERGRRTKSRPQIARPNLKHLLLDKAMIPALNANVSKVEGSVVEMLNGAAARWGF